MRHVWLGTLVTAKIQYPVLASLAANHFSGVSQCGKFAKIFFWFLFVTFLRAFAAYESPKAICYSFI